MQTKIKILGCLGGSIGYVCPWLRSCYLSPGMEPAFPSPSAPHPLMLSLVTSLSLSKKKIKKILKKIKII